jgi:hypothetical protein
MRPAIGEEIMKPSHIAAVVAVVGLAAVGASAAGPASVRGRPP